MDTRRAFVVALGSLIAGCSGEAPTSENVTQTESTTEDNRTTERTNDNSSIQSSLYLMNETSESKSISFNIKSEAGNEVISAEEEIPAYRDVVYSAVIEGQGTYSVEYSTPDGSSGQGDWTTQDCGDSEAPAGNTHAAIIANNDSIEFGANACDAIYFTAGKSNVSKTVTQSD